MRAFVSVPCGEEFAEALSTALDPLRATPGLRWAPPEQYHLTLQFLGDWPEARLKLLAEAFGREKWPSAFTLDASRLGAFPSRGDLRVLFLQMDNDDALGETALQVRRLVQQVWSDSPADFKAFRGHLTVARSRGGLEAGARRKLLGFPLPDLPSIRVAEFMIMTSRLEKSGAVHRPLVRIPLS